jgi:site-specific recombinase XerD
MIAESLGIDPHLVEREISLLPATDLVTISAGQLVSLMDKMLDVALAERVDVEHAGGNGGGQVPPLRLSEAIDGLLLASRAEGKADSTLEWYRRRISKFTRFSGDGYIGDFQASDIRAFTASLYDQGNLSKSYIAGILRAVKRLFNWCEEEGYLLNNPMERIKIPKPDDVEPKFITWGDFLRLLATTQGSSTIDRRDAAEMLVLYDTGCRASELCALKVDDVYLEEEQLKRSEKKVKKERRGPILDAVVQSIRAWLKVRPDVDTDALFVNLDARNSAMKNTQAGGKALRCDRR